MVNQPNKRLFPRHGGTLAKDSTLPVINATESWPRAASPLIATRGSVCTESLPPMGRRCGDQCDRVLVAVGQGDAHTVGNWSIFGIRSRYRSLECGNIVLDGPERFVEVLLGGSGVAEAARAKQHAQQWAPHARAGAGRPHAPRSLPMCEIQAL
jgi:hypothetical protein